jgi:hypothetical protein
MVIIRVGFIFLYFFSGGGQKGIDFFILLKMVASMIIIGDVHGKVQEYQKILQAYPEHEYIQVGDFGFSREHHYRTARETIDRTFFVGLNELEVYNLI